VKNLSRNRIFIDGIHVVNLAPIWLAELNGRNWPISVIAPIAAAGALSLLCAAHPLTAQKENAPSDLAEGGTFSTL
jgi:hypothetical protein